MQTESGWMEMSVIHARLGPLGQTGPNELPDADKGDVWHFSGSDPMLLLTASYRKEAPTIQAGARLPHSLETDSHAKGRDAAGNVFAWKSSGNPSSFAGTRHVGTALLS